MSGFSTFPLSPIIQQNIERAGFIEPTPIQKRTIPLALEGRDILGLAQTGTGKTAAFVLPLLQSLSVGPRKKVRALVVAPTRELAEQIQGVITTLGKALGLRSTAIYGGASMNRQLGELRRGVEIIVACPGRLIDHMGRASVNLSGVEMLVLDEADQMFDMGFLPAIKRIVSALPKERQTLLFSATMPDSVLKFGLEFLTNPERIELERGPVATIHHALYPISQEQKTALLLHLLKDAGEKPILIFTRTKHKATRLADQLGKEGFAVAALQGNLSQNQRRRSLDGFRAGKYRILVATDIAARGLDVEGISHIINYDIPANSETYIHRIGRTARAAKSGVAFTFVTGEDKRIVRDIEKTLGEPIEKCRVENFDYKNTLQSLDFTKGKTVQETAAQKKTATKKVIPQNKQATTNAHDRPKKHGKPRRRRFQGRGKPSHRA